MSKEQIEIIILPLETVKTWCQTLASINDSLIFWKLDKKWPTNLITDSINEIKNEMNGYYEIIREDE